MKIGKSRGFDTQFYRQKPWLNLRKWYFNENPICQLCSNVGLTTPGDVVDHIIPRSLTKDFELEPANLQTLCHRCHSQKTNLTKNINDLDVYIDSMKWGKLRFITPEYIKQNLFNELGF